MASNTVFASFSVLLLLVSTSSNAQQVVTGEAKPNPTQSATDSVKQALAGGNVKPIASVAPVTKAATATELASGAATVAIGKGAAPAQARAATVSAPPAGMKVAIARVAPRSSAAIDNERVQTELDRLDNEILLLEKQKKLEALMSEVRNSKGAGALTGTPVLIGIMGSPRSLTARLSYQGSGVVYVKAGDKLGTDYVVTLVSTNKVVLLRGKDEITLPLVVNRQGGFPIVSGRTQAVDSGGNLADRVNPTGAR